MEGKNKHNTISILTEDKPEINLRKVKLALKRAMLDYEAKRQEDDEYYDIYDDLHNSLNEGFAEPTVRKWINPNNNIIPDVEKVRVLCRYINNKRPAKAISDYLIQTTSDLDG